MSEADDLYRGALLERGRNPTNFGPLPHATHSAEGYSPLCGDRLTVHAHVEDGGFAELSFEGHACIVAVASASLMTEYLAKRSTQDAQATLDRLRSMLNESTSAPTSTTAETSSSEPSPSALAVLLPVRGHPLRRRCATLAWEALVDALAAPGLCSTKRRP